MRDVSEMNPLSVAAFFVAVIFVGMFSMHPVIIGISFLFSLLLFFSLPGKKNAKTHFWIFAVFLIASMLNPLFNHNGMTVLFVINQKPITLEALFYGWESALMVSATLYWFLSFSRIMTSEKLLYLFGAFSPKLSLILSLSLRFLSLFTGQMRKVKAAQKAVGLFKDDNIIDRVKGSLAVFSITVTWALERGIITAESMEARGYGTARRTRFSPFRFTAFDGVVLLLTILLFAATLVFLRTAEFTYYPSIGFSPVGASTLTAFGAYAALGALPLIIHLSEGLKWKSLTSKI